MALARLCPSKPLWAFFETLADGQRQERQESTRMSPPSVCPQPHRRQLTPWLSCLPLAVRGVSEVTWAAWAVALVEGAAANPWGEKESSEEGEVAVEVQGWKAAGPVLTMAGSQQVLETLQARATLLGPHFR